MPILDSTACVIAASGSTVAAVLLARASQRPEAIALTVVDGPESTYGHLFSEVMSIAAGLRRGGVLPAARVAILLPNSKEFVLSWLATNLVGATEVAINPAWTHHLLAHALGSSRASYLIVHEQFLPAVLARRAALPDLRHIWVVANEQRVPNRPMSTWDTSDDNGNLTVRPFVHLLDVVSAAEKDGLIEGMANVRPCDIASIIYTSGTTGPAKGVLMPHGQVCALAAITVQHLQIAEADTFYCVHPLFHIAGKFMACLGTLMAGGRLVLDEKFRAEQWLPCIRRYGATRTLAHGPMIEMIHRTPVQPDDHDNPMKLLVSAPLPHRIADAFQLRFGLRGIECWGMTEVGVPLWTDKDSLPGSCGRYDPELYELQVFDLEADHPVPAGQPGELVVRTNHPWLSMRGYDGTPTEMIEASRNGWFRTGDIVREGADGDFFFVDRAKERIRRRAESISSYEIESAALECGALEAAAVGVSSGFVFDDDIKLCVVAPSWEPEQLLRDMAAHLPHYMLPRFIEGFDALPRTPTNKVRKGDLRKTHDLGRLWDRQQAGISVRELYGKKF